MDEYGLRGFTGLDSRVGGNDTEVGLSYFTLTFDSSPIKGEGDNGGWFVLFTRIALPCGFPPTRE